jgi:hypothetical protein
MDQRACQGLLERIGYLARRYICMMTQLYGRTLPETPNLPSVKRFTECNMSGTRQTDYLPSVTLGKERH